MSREYIAEHEFYCAECGERILEGDAMYFRPNGGRVCASCEEAMNEGTERFDQDGFGEPEY